jgi:DNA-binding GntR family transcriptional regulator
MPTYKSLKDYVFEYISHEIHTGSLKPNQKLNENSICEILQVSRTPVREALIQLADEGILNKNPRKGFTVNQVSINKVKEIYSIIGVLEGFAASLSVNNITEEDLKIMSEYIDEMYININNGNYNSYYQLQLKFHNTFLKRCGNSELAELIDELKMKFIKQSYIINKNDDNLAAVLTETNDEHKEIYKLLKSKDAEGVEKYLRNVHWSMRYASYESIE